MADAALVDVLDARDQLEVELAGLFLAETGMADDVVEELASIAVLHYHVELFLGLDDLVELNDVGVPHLLQDLDFPGDALHVLLVVNFVLLEDLDGDLFAGERVLAEFDLAESSFAKQLAYDVVADGDRRVVILAVGLALPHLSLLSSASLPSGRRLCRVIRCLPSGGRCFFRGRRSWVRLRSLRRLARLFGRGLVLLRGLGSSGGLARDRRFIWRLRGRLRSGRWLVVLSGIHNN
mmetsp:Transcript_29514/g.44879  ORF Transcript_29514/g.44879 Transcript_29514/m.44879 type:complete len:236 (-) Transcript_29514:48-755(-)